jgi:type VI secretion system secreted protein VgrG
LIIPQEDRSGNAIGRRDGRIQEWADACNGSRALPQSLTAKAGTVGTICAGYTELLEAPMASYTQASRSLAVTTPLGADVLLLESITGTEAISEPFRFQLEMLAESTVDISFDKLLGQKVTVRLDLPKNEKRFFSGVVASFSQGVQIKSAQGDVHFIRYKAEIVPEFALLKHIKRSRIFQQLTVIDILKKVLTGLTVAYDCGNDKWEPRDYCVQYAESDFDFACRLMEEEGIFYFFKHTESGHTLVLANKPESHLDVPASASVFYEGMAGGTREEDRVGTWTKTQSLRSGKVTFWDHCFEMPYKNLQAQKTVLQSVQVGTKSHKLATGGNDKFELYGYPGEYAQRFDGIAPGGGDRKADLSKIQPDGDRTVGIRMQQDTVQGLLIVGTSNCRQFVAGYKFKLDRHFNANGAYVLTRVTHEAKQTGAFTAAGGATLSYKNDFHCIPIALPFRPQRLTPKARVEGTQTAVVVGPKGQEIFTDKYGRVKVQFNWDRDGKNDANSSCWIRVATIWAGKRWGATFLPRIGQEVIVDFLEGDPDRPIIVGSVYNADQMPPYLGEGPDSKHKHDPNLSGVKSNTTPGGQGFNELRLDDTKDKQQVFIHAERNMDVRVKNDSMELVLNNRHLIVGSDDTKSKASDQYEKVFRDRHMQVMRHHIEQIGGNMQLLVGGGDGDGNQDVVIKKDRKELIEGKCDYHVKGDQTEKIDGKQSRTVGGDRLETVTGAFHHHVKGALNEKTDMTYSRQAGQNIQEKAGQNYGLDAGMAVHIKGGMNVVLEAGMQLTIKAGASFIVLAADGVTIQGPLVKINMGGAAGAGAGSSPVAPQDAAAPADAAEAKPTAPVLADDAQSGVKSAPA